MRPLMLAPALLALLALSILTPGAAGTGPSGGPPFRQDATSAVERRYRMAAKIRPLLVFWITREDVGSARIVWHHGEDGTRGWELLIGSDPLRAPMKINRWGYVREEVQSSGASMIGVMKQSDEESIEQAKARVQNESREGYTFKMIRARTADGVATSTTSSATFRQDFTYRDLDALLAALQGPAVRTGPPKEVRVAPGVKPGLLVAVTDLLHESVEVFRRAGPSGLARRAAKYVYNGTVYDLSLETPHVEKNARYGGRTYPVLLDASFEIRSAAGSREYFSMVFGAEGALAEIPVCITYQPRWWFKAELVLDDREKF